MNGDKIEPQSDLTPFGMVDAFVNDFKQVFGSDILHATGCGANGDVDENYINNGNGAEDNNEIRSPKRITVETILNTSPNFAN